MSITGFLFIPEHIMEMDDLSLQEKCVYGRIIGLTKKEGYCYASNEWIGEKLGLSEDRTRRYIYSLRDKGLLTIRIQKTKASKENQPEDWGTKRKIYVYQVQTPIGVVENTHRGVVENTQYSIREESNTENNIKKNNIQTNNDDKNSTDSTDIQTSLEQSFIEDLEIKKQRRLEKQNKKWNQPISQPKKFQPYEKKKRVISDMREGGRW